MKRVPLSSEQKSAIRLIIAARLILWTGYWNENSPGSYGYIGFTRAFNLLYKELTGETYIRGAEKYETTQTVRGLWRYKQSYLVENFLSDPRYSNYSIDTTHELRAFFGEIQEFISYLSPDDQFQLIINTMKCHEQNTYPFR